MKENVNRYNIAMLEQVKHIMDGNLQETERTAYQISFSSKLHNIISIDYPPDVSNTYQYIDFKNELAVYKRTNTFISDFYVYFPKDDVILMPDMKTNSSTFYDNFYKYMEIDYNSWIEILNSYHYKYYLPVKEILAYSKPQKVITYIQSLPFGNKKDIKACLVIFIDESKVKKLLDNVKWATNGYICIINKDNQVIMSTGNILDNTDIPYSEFNNDVSVYKDKSGSEIMVYCSISQESDWKYISILPKNEFMEKVNNMKRWIQNNIFFYLVLGLMLAFFLTYKNYNPVKNLISAIFSEKKIKDKNIQNEYDFIKQSILDGMSENRKLSDIIYRQMPAVKSNFLMRVMYGIIDYSTITKESLKFIDIDFVSDYFMLLIIEIENFGSIFSQDSENEKALARFALTNMGNELVNEYGKGYLIELESSRLALLFNVFEERLDKAESDLLNISKVLRNAAQEHFDVFITIGISSIHKGTFGIGESYKEASRAIDYKFVKGIGEIICFNEIESVKQNYYYPLESELIIINTVKNGDYNSVEKILDKIYNDNFKPYNVAPEHGKSLFFNIMSTLVRIMNTTNIKFENILTGETDIVNYLTGCSTIEEMHEKIKKAFKLICLYIDSNWNNRKNHLLEQIKNYIAKNYTDNTLCLVSIADNLNITPQYLSTYFKNANGENLSDYIAKIRVGKAKQLLAEGQLTVFEIAKSIGYTNDVGFIRVFKKIEGVTPGKYKSMISSEHK